MSKITDIEDFEDLSRCSLEKLTKLRDRARQYRIECRAEYLAAQAREIAINREMANRQPVKPTDL